MSSNARAHEFLGGILPAECLTTFAAQDGVPALPLAAPATLAQALEVLRLARNEHWTVLPIGLGSKLGWARAPERCDLVLSSRNLRGIEAYEPADGTLTARAGTRWSELVEATRARHHLSPELARAEHTTLGGVLGAGASGLDRLRHGPLRHQVLGIQALQADGSLVKSGGRVVKNVTGYDLHRLWCGSEGSLCFLLEATLRLYPAPEELALLRIRCASLAQGLALGHSLLRLRIQPVAVVLRAREHESASELALVLAGRPAALASELEVAQKTLAGAELLRADEARRARAELRELEFEDGSWAPLSLALRPSNLPATVEHLQRVAHELGLPMRLVCHPLLGSLAASFPGVALSAERVAAIGDALAASGVTLRWRGLGANTPALALPTAAAALMQRLKHTLDPKGLFPRGPLP